MKMVKKKTADIAIVGVVTAILLLGIIVAVISLVQTVYVPKIMEQREADHMDQVAEQFSYLTSVIDGQAADRTQNIPIATSITLGNKELPYLLSVRSFGTLEILQNTYTISVSNSSSSGGDVTSIFRIGTIMYSSSNAYFLDQFYIYEAGAMIVGQSQGNLMMIRPGFFVVYDQVHNSLNISFDVINISSIGQKTIAAGFGTYPIQTEFRDLSAHRNFSLVQNMTITTKYSNAWSIFINRSLINSGLNSEGYGTQFLLSDSGHGVKVDFSSALSPPVVNLFVRIIDIQAQIGPGWIE